MRAWLFLIGAGLVEVVMAYALKRAESWTRPGASFLGVVAALVSIYLLAMAMQRIPLAVAYLVWTGIGAVGVVTVGVVVFGEVLSVARLACIVLVVAGTLGLRILES